MFRRRNEDGAALLSVLLVLSIMSAVLVGLLRDMNLAVRITTNAAETERARYQAIAAEGLAKSQLRQILERTGGVLNNTGNWNGQTVPVQIDGGLMTLQVSDHTVCFNENGVVIAADDTERQNDNTRYVTSLALQRQFSRLLEALDIPSTQAQRIAAEAADWIDSDQIASRLGAEDTAYRSALAGPLPANQLLRSVSELRALKSMTPALFDRIAPYLCALPQAQPAVMNVNLMSATDAPLLAALLEGQLGVQSARAALFATPPTGWTDLTQFWSQPGLADLQLGRSAVSQVGLTSTFFELNVSVQLGSGRATQSTLIRAEGDRIETVARSWQNAL